MAGALAFRSKRDARMGSFGSVDTLRVEQSVCRRLHDDVCQLLARTGLRCSNLVDDAQPVLVITGGDVSGPFSLSDSYLDHCLSRSELP